MVWPIISEVEPAGQPSYGQQGGKSIARAGRGRAGRWRDPWRLDIRFQGSVSLSGPTSSWGALQRLHRRWKLWKSGTAGHNCPTDLKPPAILKHKIHLLLISY